MPTPAQQARDIFLEAVDLDAPEQRASYLEAACAGDPELRHRVEALLAAHGRPESLLDRAAVEARPTIAYANGDAAPHAEGPGTAIGPYTLLERIGEGGMGVVYRAEQAEPVRREVALKLIKPGMDTEQVLARFAAERQALEVMEHPNIARVLDAGATPAGRPYFVMELVRGVPITAHCDGARLTPRQRLELFKEVCAAVQHAHQKGIIHRDLKPSNVLVAEVDGKPVPKVIDFGVAKAIDQQRAERTLFTQHGAIVGTPEYMSPEQAGAAPDIDTRTDVYGLGVLLYELLTGTTPLDRETLRRAALDEVLRRVREEEPPTPSTRLSGTSERLPSVAAVRATEPARLAKLVRGDLDWVVMKALEKDRARRYETANGLARDIQRYLDGDPVEAGPPSRVYRLRKFARKHRAALATAVAFIVLLIAAAALSTWQAIRATRADSQARAQAERAAQAEQAARAEAGKAAAINDFLTRDLLSQAEPAKNSAEDHVELLEVLDRAAVKVGERFAGQAEVAEALRTTIARTYHGLGAFSKAETQWRAILESSRRRAGPEAPDALLAMSELAHTLGHEGRPDEALALAKPASEGLLNALGHDHTRTLTGRHNLALLYQGAGRTTEAIALHEVILKSQEVKLGPDHPDTLVSRNSLADAYRDAGRTAEAITLLKETLESTEAKFGSDHPDTLDRGNSLARAYLAAGRTAEAIALHEATLRAREARLGPDHPNTLASSNDLANAYLAAGRTAEAIALHEATLKLLEAKLGPDHPQTLDSRNSLAVAYAKAGRTAEALPRLEATLRASESKLGLAYPDTLISRHNLAVAYGYAGRTAEAIALFEATLKLLEAKLGPDHLQTLDSRNSLAVAYAKAGRTAEALPRLEATLRARESKLGPDHPDTLDPKQAT
jgi:serine/threonine protein kinase/ATP-dependent protease HslVU (ClpYQ) peptidase subunit